MTVPGATKSKPAAPAASKKSRIVRVIVVGAAWLAMLVVVSAAVADRGPAWLAGTVGGVVAALPAIWHWLRERRRAATTSVFTGGDRLVLRLIVVGGLSIAIAWATARGGMYAMLKRSAAWWWPSSPATIAAGDRFASIPADAVVVGWLDNRELGNEPADDEPDHIVFAARAGAAILVATGKPDALDRYAAQLTKIEPWLAKVPPPVGPWAPMIASRPSRDRLVLAPATWPAIAGPPSPLVADLATVPPSAAGALAIQQHVPVSGATSATMWIVATGGDDMTIEARLVAPDAAGVAKLVDSVTSQIASLRVAAPAICRDDAGKILDRAAVTGDGTTVRATLTATGTELGSLVLCVIASAQ